VSEYKCREGWLSLFVQRKKETLGSEGVREWSIREVKKEEWEREKRKGKEMEGV